MNDAPTSSEFDFIDKFVIEIFIFYSVRKFDVFDVIINVRIRMISFVYTDDDDKDDDIYIIYIYYIINIINIFVIYLIN